MIRTRQSRLPRFAVSRLALFVLFAAGLMAAGCRTISNPVPVIGGQADLAALEGAWFGEYQSIDSGRAGSISFMLEADADTAYGDVVMHPQGWDVMAPDKADMIPPNASQTLAIQFVQIGRHRLSGVLDPYRDPLCGCTLETVFEGRQEGDVIEGTFRSKHLEGGAVQHGTWRVTRRSAQHQVIQ